jgi:uncharacterized RDD family membrane protein YckC
MLNKYLGINVTDNQNTEVKEYIPLTPGVDFPLKTVSIKHRMWALTVDLLLLLPIAQFMTPAHDVVVSMNRNVLSQADLDVTEGTITYLDWFVVFFGEFLSAGGGAIFIQNSIIAFIVVGVSLVWMWQRWGATPGKMIFGIRVVDVDTLKIPTLRQSIIRYFGFFLLTAAMGVGFIWALFDREKRQTLYDNLANTRVIYSRPEDPDAKENKFKRQTYIAICVLILFLIINLMQS